MITISLTVGHESKLKKEPRWDSIQSSPSTPTAPVLLMEASLLLHTVGGSWSFFGLNSSLPSQGSDCCWKTITGSLRLEETSRMTTSNHQPTATMPTEHITITLPRTAGHTWATNLQLASPWEEEDSAEPCEAEQPQCPEASLPLNTATWSWRDGNRDFVLVMDPYMDICTWGLGSKEHPTKRKTDCFTWSLGNMLSSNGDGSRTPSSTTEPFPQAFKQQRHALVSPCIAQSQLNHNYLIVKDHASARHCLH